MKRTFVLVLVALLATGPCFAQSAKYFIDDREVTEAVFKALSSDAVASVKFGMEEGAMVWRATLKRSEAEPVTLPEGAPVLRGGADADEMMRQIYEQTTILKAGDLAADFTAARYAGGEVRLSDLQGKVVLVTFWATWCKPCLRELSEELLPAQVLWRFADDPDFVFLPVAYTDTSATLDAFFATEQGAKYLYLKESTLLDSDKTIHALYAKQGIPRSLVVDRNGMIVSGSLGATPAAIEQMIEAIGAALGR